MQHMKSVETHAVFIADKLQLSDKQKVDLQVAAALHDIGKLAVDKSILNKTGQLTPSDWICLKSHPEVGARIVGSISEWRDAAKGIYYHHERMDGTGYPEGLKGNRIPTVARIVSVIDAFDAMTSDRAYRKAMNQEKAIEILQKCQGIQFDPIVVDAFIDSTH